MILREEVEGFWEFLEPFVLKGVQKSEGMLSIALIKEMLLSGYGAAFVTIRNEEVESLFIITRVHYATFNSARVLLCVGKNLNEAVNFLPALEAWVIGQDCVELEGWCKPGMVRLLRRLGWKAKLTLVTRDLRRKLQ